MSSSFSHDPPRPPRILEAAAHHKVRRAVFTSSGVAAGHGEVNTCTTESM